VLIVRQFCFAHNLSLCPLHYSFIDIFFQIARFYLFHYLCTCFILGFYCGLFVQAVSYPVEAGAPLGGHGFSRYIMLEVHYNNPDKVRGTFAP